MSLELIWREGDPKQYLVVDGEVVANSEQVEFHRTFAIESEKGRLVHGMEPYDHTLRHYEDALYVQNELKKWLAEKNITISWLGKRVVWKEEFNRVIEEPKHADDQRDNERELPLPLAASGA